MTLINCPDCSRLCFTDATDCQGCGQVFQPGALALQARVNNKAFMTKAYVMFGVPFLLLMALLCYAALRGLN